jgi:signal transduction histidine kinase
MMNHTIENVESDISTILSLGVDIQSYFKEMQSYFDNDHNSYCRWLLDRLKQLFEENLGGFFQQLGLDWATVHYRTRHVGDKRAHFDEWLQVGIPLYDYLRRFSDDLQVSKYGKAPYFSDIIEESFKQGRPFKIFFVNEGEDISRLKGNHLIVNYSVVNGLIAITEGQLDQGLITQPELSRFREVCGNKSQYLSRDIYHLIGLELTEAEIIGWLRNVCRVTILILKLNVPEVNLPRVIVHAPVYLGSNLVGGVAFIGSNIGQFVDERNGVILSIISRTIHSSIRLLEEEQREKNIRYIEELGRARAEFIQRMSHTLFDPINEVHHLVEAALKENDSTILKNSNMYLERIRTVAGDILLAFAKKNVDDILVIKFRKIFLASFVKTLVFMNKMSYERRHVSLASNELPSDWVLWGDKDSLIEVFMNLLSNALRFAKKYVSLKVWREHSASLKGESYFFCVSDDGDGVRADLVDKLFEPGLYESLQETGNESHGFGLFLGRRVIESHNGLLYYNESFEDGAQFVVELPVKRSC